MQEQHLLTLRELSQQLEVAIHRVKYAIAEHNITPRQRAGIVRLWSEEDLPTVRAALARTATRKGVPHGK